MRKPDPRIFQMTLDQLEVQPGEAVFLDDLGVNLKAAKALGIRTIKVGKGCFSNTDHDTQKEQYMSLI